MIEQACRPHRRETPAKVGSNVCGTSPDRVMRNHDLISDRTERLHDLKEEAKRPKNRRGDAATRRVGYD